MIKAGKGGLLYFTSSAGGLMGGPITMPYSTAKAAVISMAEGYRRSLDKYGIQVAVCCPGGIKSNIGESIYNRPGHLKNTGYVENDRVVGALKKVYQGVGLDPIVLAGYIKQKIEEESFYIITEDVSPMLEARHKELMASITDLTPKTPEEMERVKEGWSHMKDVGGVREDLDWVKPSPPRQPGPPASDYKK